MLKSLLVILAALVFAAPALAQSTPDNCGQGLPCGAVPWRLPQLPVLVSPSPFPTVYQTAVSTATPTLTPTTGSSPTPTIQPTATGGLPEISDSLSTLQDSFSATQLVVYNDQGTEIVVDDVSNFDQLGQNAGVFFGYARGLGTINLGANITPLITFTLIAFFTVLAVSLLTYGLPIFAAVFGVIRKAVQIVLDFIP